MDEQAAKRAKVMLRRLAEALRNEADQLGKDEAEVVMDLAELFRDHVEILEDHIEIAKDAADAGIDLAEVINRALAGLGDDFATCVAECVLNICGATLFSPLCVPIATATCVAACSQQQSS